MKAIVAAIAIIATTITLASADTIEGIEAQVNHHLAEATSHRAEVTCHETDSKHHMAEFNKHRHPQKPNSGTVPVS